MLLQLFQLAVVLAAIVYAFMLMFLGPRRAGKAMSGSLAWIVGGTGKAAMRLGKILIMTLVNSTTLLVRTIASRGRSDQVAEAWTKFAERMSDVIFGA